MSEYRDVEAVCFGNFKLETTYVSTSCGDGCCSNSYYEGELWVGDKLLKEFGGEYGGGYYSHEEAQKAFIEDWLSGMTSDISYKVRQEMVNQQAYERKKEDERMNDLALIAKIVEYGLGRDFVNSRSKAAAEWKEMLEAAHTNFRKDRPYEGYLTGEDYDSIKEELLRKESC